MTPTILCVHLPKTEANVVPSSLAVLAGLARRHSILVQCRDFNLDWIDVCVAQGLDRRNCLTGITWNVIPNAQVRDLADRCIAEWAQKVADIGPQVLAISVFTYYSQYFARGLAARVREIAPQIQIVMGGQGIKTGMLEPPRFAQTLAEQGTIDYYLEGNAERGWLAWLNDRFQLCLAPDADSFLDPRYCNDYSDFEFERYRGNAARFTGNYAADNVVVTYSTSEGCVRACDFCEVHRYWPYRQRRSDQVAQDLAALMEQSGGCHVDFSDSLVNGNIREFDRMLTVLIDLRQRYPDLTWSGQFIVRGAKQFGERYYQRLAQSGVSSLALGIETGSERLRRDMNKPFTDADLDWTMSMLDRYHIRCTFLQFVGHPQETLEDFEDTCRMYQRYQQYANRVIKTVQLNFMMAIHPNTPLWDKIPELGIHTTADPGLWSCATNPTLTVAERMRRRLLLSELLDQLGYQKAHDEHVALAEYTRAYSKYRHAAKIIDRT